MIARVGRKCLGLSLALAGVALLELAGRALELDLPSYRVPVTIGYGDPGAP